MAPPGARLLICCDGAVGVVGVRRAGTVALRFADDVSGRVVGIRFDKAAAGVGQLAEAADGVIQIICCEPRLVGDLGDIPVNAVLDRERAVWLNDRRR